MNIFKKVMLYLGALSVALLPMFYERISRPEATTWAGVFSRGEAILIGVVFAADVLIRCLFNNKNEAARILIGVLALGVLVLDLPFYGGITTHEHERRQQMKLEESRYLDGRVKERAQDKQLDNGRPSLGRSKGRMARLDESRSPEAIVMDRIIELSEEDRQDSNRVFFWSMMGLVGSSILEIAVILEEEL